MTAYKLLSRLRYLRLVENGFEGTLAQWQTVAARDALWDEVVKLQVCK